MKHKSILVAIVALGAATWSLAQLPGGYSAAPTDRDYRLRIVEPKDGATITGKDFTIVMSQPFVPTGAGVNEKEQRDVLTPVFQIWIDGKDFGNLPTGTNVFTAHDVSYGPHKIVVVAKNAAGDVVDRKEIGITTAVAIASQSTTQMTQPAAPAVAPAPVAPPAPEPAAPAPSTPKKLPTTGSSAPAAAAAGLGLLVAGLALLRRV